MLISIMTASNFAFGAESEKVKEPLKINGADLHAVQSAYTAFQEKQPEAKLENYEVIVHPKADGQIQVVFLPKLADGETPKFGGGTSLGKEINVWVSAEGYKVERVTFAR